MKENNKLSLYVAYYLARFNDEAYSALGFGNKRQTHARIGEILNIKPNTIKNRRDGFDPLFGHRAGWHQRPLSPGYRNVAEALDALEKEEIEGIVKDILENKNQGHTDELNILRNIVEENTESNQQKNSGFVARGITGRAAEEFFIRFFTENKKPYPGILHDHRNNGCGYDFLIKENDTEYYIEVKGLSDNKGNILFTGKEWETARKNRQKYILCIVANVHDKPEIRFIHDPFATLKPDKKITRPIHINWVVNSKDLE